jgi:fused signal recognition particle receptor
MNSEYLVFVVIGAAVLVGGIFAWRVSQKKAKPEAIQAPVAATLPVVAKAPVIPEPTPTPVVLPTPSKPTLDLALSKTKQGWVSRLSALFSGGSQEKSALYDQVEEVLYSADIGVKTSARLLEIVKENLNSSDQHEIQAKVTEAIAAILRSAQRPEITKNGTPGPKVIMFVGVNGVGKTTSIGKLAAQFAKSGHTVVMGAGDTFRAAAAEQLDVWAQRSGASIVRGKEQADPSSVLFDAVSKGKTENADFVLCDTAGRLHTKTNLMDELQKVHRVLSKACEGAPHEVLLVVDATTGQNAIEQARQFMAATPLTGVILTKLDGTAKGGVVIGIADELKIPIRYIGVGEGAADLRPFDADEFARALFSSED